MMKTVFYLASQILESVSDLFANWISQRIDPLLVALILSVFLPVPWIEGLHIVVFLLMKNKKRGWTTGNTLVVYLAL